MYTAHRSVFLLLLAFVLTLAGSPLRAATTIFVPGRTVTLSASADGPGPMRYQWFKNSSTISGATSSTYTIAASTTADQGAYTVIAMNSAGNGVAESVVLSVDGSAPAGPTGTAPSISTQPTSVTVTAGNSATFSVNASGDPVPSYQWRFNGVDIPSATSSSYTINNSISGNAGSYTVAVSNGYGSALSNAATLTVNAAVPSSIAPVFTSQPANLSLSLGATATFTVAASGTPTPTYQWRFNGINIPGATSATYSIANVILGSAGLYTVVATNSAGTTSSNAATLTVGGGSNPSTSAPAFTTQPVNSWSGQGSGVTFTSAASGSPTYQWLFNGVNIPGATSASYTIGNAYLSNVGFYAVVATNSAGSTTSNTVSLSVGSTSPSAAPTISAQPSNLTVGAGASATFSVVATGSPAPAYQWLLNGTNISGATSASYTLSNVTSGNAGSYTVKVTNSAGSVTSSAATLVVSGSSATIPVISAQPSSKTVANNAAVSFSVVATATPAPAYQWRRNGAAISGATSPTYAIANASSSNAGSYTVVVSNSAGSVTSSAATLTVNSPTGTLPAITTQPTSKTVMTGAATSFTVAATGAPSPTYQWKFKGTLILGATSATYSIPSAAAGNAGSYTVTVSNSAGSVESSAATLGVQKIAPKIVQQPANRSTSAGNSTTFSVVAEETTVTDTGL